MDETILDTLDAAATDRILVYGSLPSEGRDLDLLVRASERIALEAALRNAGYIERRGVWARFGAEGTTVVDFTSAEAWELPPAELDALYADGIPLERRRHLVRPSPHHTLLILARRAASRPLGERQRRRLADAVAEDPDAWGRARADAVGWRAAEQLEALERGRVSPRTRARTAGRVVRMAARGNVVCLSGLDGAGKSTQAQALRDALHAVGIDAAVDWRPFGQNPGLGRVVRTGSLLLRAIRRFGPARTLGDRAARGEAMLATPGMTPRRGPAGRAVLFAWTTTVALANAFHQRRTAAEHALRGRVVIFDRYSLDSIVRLRYAYGDAQRFRFQALLIRALSPQPRSAFLLEVAPETAFARKVDQWSLDDLRRQAELYREEAARLGVKRLDGERPPHELAAEIAAEVWRALT